MIVSCYKKFFPLYHLSESTHSFFKLGSATLNRAWLRNQVFRLKSGQINLFEPDSGRIFVHFRKKPGFFFAARV